MQISDTAASASVGRRLREARESLGLSVAEVADQTKFAVRQIEALEADDFEHLPEMTFVRGFVRSYAKLLHLDAEALFALLPRTSMAPQPLVSSSVGVPFPTAQSGQRINLVWLGGALLLAVLIVAFVVWQYTRPVANNEPAKVETPLALPEEVQAMGAAPAQTAVAEPVAPSPVAAQPAAPATVPVSKSASPAPASPTASAAGNAAANPAVTPSDAGKPSALRLVFDEESWTEIRNRDDKIISSQVNPRGSELKLDGRAPFSLVIGHAASVHLYRRDKPVDLTPYINSSSEVARLTVE
ncbi:MAG: DUF4115 domain-containing protein [Nitrosomonadales bacterium]|nr:DUF4115 domain-containing protein [Nitrosomonadales bacterium]